jgi:integrase
VLAEARGRQYTSEEVSSLPRQRFHDLRHCCVTRLLSQGAPARVVQEVLRHSQVRLTLDTYSHVMPTMLKEAAEAMNRAFGTDARLPV